MRQDADELLAALPLGVYVCSARDGTIQRCNRTAAELWGRTPAIGDRDDHFCRSLHLLRPDGTPLGQADTPMAEALRGGGRRTSEMLIERPDGSRVLVSVAAVPLHDGDGRLIGAANLLEDITARRAAEDALRASEAQYRAIVQDQAEMVCRFRPDGTITFANRAYCDYFAGTAEQFIGHEYVPNVHPEDVAAVQVMLGALAPTAPVGIIRNRVLRGDGAVRWTQWTNHAVYDGQGRMLEIQATGHDITDQRQAEEDAARLAAIVAGADDAIFSKTLDGVITSWNTGAERMFGYTAPEVIGQPVTLLVPPERLDEERQILARLGRGEMIAQFESERLARDGRLVPVSLSLSPVRNAAGLVTGASTIARDVTDRRRADETLKDTVHTLEVLYRLADLISRARGLKEVCEAAVEAVMAVTRAQRASVLVFDDEGIMRFVTWRGLSDAYRAAVDGHSPWRPDAVDPTPIVVEDVRHDARLADLREKILGEGIRSLAFIPLLYLRQLLGKFMVYHDSPRTFTPEEIRLLTTIAQHVGFGVARVRGEEAITDLLRRERTARREADVARREAERASRSKDEFLAMLAHELRNPLGVIVNAIALIEDSPDLQPPLRRTSAMIQRQAGHLARLLDDLLDVARITSGRIELVREPIDLRLAIKQAVELQRHRLEAKSQQAAVTLPETAVMVVGDPVRVQQVLGNLLNNASKYTPAQGAVEISLAADAPHAVVRVRDNGTGIAADQLGPIFELFVQANPTLARTEGGLGIGLTLVKQVVELHGGDVSARSGGLGAGSEFTVRLPLAIAPSAVPEGASATSATPVATRILVIEDHEDGREALVSTLERYGHTVYQAGSGKEGVRLAGRHAPEVVLVDIGLPDVDGYEVGTEIRRQLGERVRLIALTGYGQPSDRARSEKAGFDAHLVKPVAPPRLMEVVESLRRPTTP